jgi:hypothetical protein
MHLYPVNVRYIKRLPGQCPVIMKAIVIIARDIKYSLNYSQPVKLSLLKNREREKGRKTSTKTIRTFYYKHLRKPDKTTAKKRFLVFFNDRALISWIAD